MRYCSVIFHLYSKYNSSVFDTAPERVRGYDRWPLCLELLLWGFDMGEDGAWERTGHRSPPPGTEPALCFTSWPVFVFTKCFQVEMYIVWGRDDGYLLHTITIELETGSDSSLQDDLKWWDEKNDISIWARKEINHRNIFWIKKKNYIMLISMVPHICFLKMDRMKRQYMIDIIVRFKSRKYTVLATIVTAEIRPTFP